MKERREVRKKMEGREGRSKKMSIRARENLVRIKILRGTFY